MSIPERVKKFDVSADASPVLRPKIWVEGQQRPRFDLRAFATTSYGIAKRDLAPEIVEAATRLQGLGHSVARGERRVRVDWAGRAARFVPSCERVGAWTLGVAGLLGETGGLLNPVDAVADALAYPNLTRAAPPLRPASRPDAEPTLDAIRSAISSALPHAIPADPARPNAAPGQLGRLARRGTAWAMLGVMLAFALPVGAAKALSYHLNGGDLREWS